MINANDNHENSEDDVVAAAGDMVVNEGACVHGTFDLILYP